MRSWLARQVDFAVRPPRIPNASLVGARLANVRDRQAAYLLYDRGGQRISVFLFDPGNLEMGGRRRAHVGNRDVYLDGRAGYRVVMYRDRDIGYAITSDMDDDNMLQLVSSPR